MLATLLFVTLCSYSLYAAPEHQLAIQELLQPLQKKATVALVVTDSNNGAVLFESNPHTYLQPASTMKILTAVAAQGILAPRSPFQTSMQVYGTQENHTLHGSILIDGGGDPNLTSQDLQSFLDSLQNHQIHRIHGNILIKSNHFDSRIHTPGTVWEEVNDCYAAPTSSLTLDNNCFTVTLHEENQRLILDNPNLDQPIKNRILLQNTCPHPEAPSTHHSVSSNTRIVDHDPFSMPQKLTGCWANQQHPLELKLSVNNPAHHFTEQLQKKLQHANIALSGSILHRDQPPSNQPLLWQQIIPSSDLKTLVEDMLVFSNNRIANHLFKQIGYRLSGDNSSWDRSEQAMLKALAQYGLVDEDISIADGAGLSRNNRITASFLHQALQTIYQTPSLSTLIPSFAQPGKKGTLQHRLKKTQRPLYAKTGYLKGVTAIAGFIDPYGESPKTFTLLINGHKNLDKDYEKIENSLFSLLEQL